MELRCHESVTDSAPEWGAQPGISRWRANLVEQAWWTHGERLDASRVMRRIRVSVDDRRHRNPLRNMTILFSDLSSSVDLSAQMDCFAYVGLLHGLRTLFRSTIVRHGGTIARLQGDGVLAVFGHDHPSDDDGYRAICCALELHDAVRAIALDAETHRGAALHSGIYAGLTYLESGDVERGRFDLIGNAPNLAARLSGLADRDGIFATEQVIAPHLDDFSVAERQELQIRGWPAPIAAYAVLGHEPQTPS